MISLGTWFWLMVIFFAVMGMTRGWTREIIVTSSLILSLFFIDQFGYQMISFVGTLGDIDPGDIDAIRRRQFYVLTAVHMFIAFWGYQGPTLAGSRVGDRLRVRDSLQDKVLGAIVGALNGYLIVGTIWAFLEYTIDASGTWTQMVGEYPFGPTVLIRPGQELANLIARLPIPTLSPYLMVLVVVVFLFVIIVMI